jgi:hypothetical protein
MWESLSGSPRMGNKSLTKRALTIILPVDVRIKSIGDEYKSLVNILTKRFITIILSINNKLMLVIDGK